MRRIKETTVVAYTVEKGTPDEIVFNIFQRINTGGTILKPQEIRQALYQGKATILIEKLAKCDEFLQATQNAIRSDRMQDREYVTRFIAFTELNFEKEYRGNIDEYLIKAMKLVNTYDDNKIRKLEKRKRRLQRSISRKYLKNKKGESYCKTSNIIKSEKKLLKIIKKLTNIRHNYLHQTTTEIIKRKPSFICIEDLSVSKMMKNKHLSKSIQQQNFYEFRQQIEYKSKWNNIKLIIADRYFPSSKLCSCCGDIKKDLKLSDRIYKCKCGNIIDRDLQAALNLKKYGEDVLKFLVNVYMCTNTLVRNLRLWRVYKIVSRNVSMFSKTYSNEVGMKHKSL